MSRQPTLDSISVYSRLEDEARAWATRDGGSVVELHAYGMEPDLDSEQIVSRMRAELAALWPETSSLNVVDVRSRILANAPLFATGASAQRPGVTTRAAGLRLAGDWIHLDFPTALMERALASGVSPPMTSWRARVPDASRCCPCHRADCSHPWPRRGVEDLLAADRAHVWHPYASMVDPLPVQPVVQLAACG